MAGGWAVVNFEATACQYTVLTSQGLGGKFAPMAAKTAQLQIRVTSAQKRALKRAAARAGSDVSSYVLARALPTSAIRLPGMINDLRDPALRDFAFANLADLLVGLTRAEFAEAVGDAAGIDSLAPLDQNLVAAMVEQAASRLGDDTAPPSWTSEIAPLEEPWFAGGLRSLRPYLLVTSPVPFRRRNLFVERGLGARV